MSILDRANREIQNSGRGKTKKQKHIHQYHRLSNGLWHCALPDCYHFMPHNVAENVPGKPSLCWGCGEGIILDENNMKDSKPVCLECKSNSVNVSDGEKKDNTATFILSDDDLMEFMTLQSQKEKK